MKRQILLCFVLLFSSLFGSDYSELQKDLKVIAQIEKDLTQRLPIVYSQVMLVGYINMPSARMNDTGILGISAAYTPPYQVYNLNFQPVSFGELSGSFRIFKGQAESNFGHLGYGDDADRTANFKIGIDPSRYGFKYLPAVSLGMEDFLGSKRFHSPFVVITEQLPDLGLEFSLGYGKGRYNKWFGGVAWSPWFAAQIPILKNFTLVAEYDCIDYENHPDEHNKGRDVKSRINVGGALTIRDFLQIKASTLRGTDYTAMASIFYNFGNTQGLFPKKDDPNLYSSPKNLEPIGHLRTERSYAKELAFAFDQQGFNLSDAWLGYNQQDERILWIKVLNLRYWRNEEVRERIAFLLSNLNAPNIDKIFVIIEENGIDIETYKYEPKYLELFQENKISLAELEILSPIIDCFQAPNQYEATKIYHQRKLSWAITMRPRLLTFFGSTKGKLKYSLGWVFSPEGYLFDKIYYKLQVAYNILSSLSDVGDMDQYNPSQILNVRSDLVKYYKTQTVSLEQAFLQKGWNMGKGFYSRLAMGFFEVAYGGFASEILYYPTKSNFAIGIEGAVVWKRDYEGLGFQRKIRKLNGFTPEYVDFIGTQYFLDLYYDVKPIDISAQVKVGQFLAKDKGARFQLTKYYPSGLQFSVWYTLTTAKDIVNGHRYYDRGIAFVIPFDVFLPKSSRTFVGYAISDWLRDVGATSSTGKPLYPTINSNRIY